MQIVSRSDLPRQQDAHLGWRNWRFWLLGVPSPGRVNHRESAANLGERQSAAIKSSERDEAITVPCHSLCAVSCSIIVSFSSIPLQIPGGSLDLFAIGGQRQRLDPLIVNCRAADCRARLL